MNDLWTAILNPHSPNYQRHHTLLGTDEVPLKSPRPIVGKARGIDGQAEFYMVDFEQLSVAQMARVVEDICRRFEDVSPQEVLGALDSYGILMPAKDLIVSFSMRAFL